MVGKNITFSLPLVIPVTSRLLTGFFACAASRKRMLEGLGESIGRKNSRDH